ncbi:MAG: T9SS type A sorting domain-containing protein [Clostridia bacterium]|nr:T9SS type A sorting domain-containing protein [Clostridia bacterium]
MKTIFTFILIMFAALAWAQPEITQANLPQTGDHVVIAICSDPVNPGNSGAMQTWDMSSLTQTEEQSFTYIPSAEWPLADSFPEATLCARSWQDDYSYYKVSPTSLTVEGHVVTTDPADTTVIVFSNSEQILELPYTLASNFIDNFEGTSYIPTFGAFPFDGSLDFEADGYGTLILPTGTYNNVVRYHFFRSQTNYFNGIPAGTITKEQWAWVSADFRFWLLLMEENWDGFSTTPLIWYDKNPYPVSTDINAPGETTVSVFPNPVKANQNLSISWDKSELLQISLLRMDGSPVVKENLALETGSNSYRCPDVSAGIYILKIETHEKGITQKLSVYR